MSFGFRFLLDGAKKLAINGPGAQPAPLDRLFVKTDPAVDGDACLHDCDACTIKYPRSFKVEQSDTLYGMVKGWSTHLLVATGKADWVRDVADEKGSVMQAVDNAAAPTNGKLMLSASNMPIPGQASTYDAPTRVLLLPAFVVVDHVTPASVPALLHDLVSAAPTNTTDTAPWRLPALPAPLTAAPAPHSVLILLCSQKTRDARCGQSAPLLRRELERHLRPLGLFRDLDDERPGGVGIYFISHVGGHKYSANVLVYRRPNAFGLDDVHQADLTPAEVTARVRAAVPAVQRSDDSERSEGQRDKEQSEDNKDNSERSEEKKEAIPAGAAQCIWLARVRPEDCENLVQYTVLQGKVVKPESQLRGGFDRSRGLMSW